MKKHLYVSDMDGTLLATGGYLSPFSQKALTKLLQSGALFTVASARSYTSVQEVFREIPINLPVVTHDGAVLYDLKKQQALTAHGLPKTMVYAIYQKSLEMGCSPFLECLKDHREYFVCDKLENDGMKWLYEYRQKAGAEMKPDISDISSFADTVISFTVVDKPEPLLLLQQKLLEIYSNKIKIHFYSYWDCTDWACLTIHNAGAHKGQGLKDLVKWLTHHPDEVTVFGDNHNDIAMFEICKRAIAVGNAIPELNAKATHLIGHHTEDSVIKFIWEDYHQQKVPDNFDNLQEIF